MSEEKIICPNCKTENNSNDSYCRECGAKLAQQDIEQSHLRKKTHKRKRIKINQENTEDKNYEIEYHKNDFGIENLNSHSVKYCPVCGTEYKDEDIFCKECGTQIQHSQ